MSEMDQIVVDTANRIFAGAANSREVFDAAIWSKIEEAGLDRLLLGEADGGAGDAFEVRSRAGPLPWRSRGGDTACRNARCELVSRQGRSKGPAQLQGARARAGVRRNAA